jgi:hypothetical protein
VLPVRFALGRFRLATRPNATASPPVAKIIGICHGRDPGMPSSPTPGSPTSICSRPSMPTWPSPIDQRLGTPEIPAIRFARGADFVASLVRFRCICGAPHMPGYVAQTNMWRRAGSTSVLGGIVKSCATYL